VKVNDLFSVLSGWSQPFADRGHDTFAVDIEPRFSPDLLADVMDVTPADLPWHPDVVLASPPCECFSVASIGTHWGGGWRAYEPKTEAAERAVRVVERTRDLIAGLNPDAFVIENPRGVLRKLGLLHSERVTVTYCQYGDRRMKPTDLWGGFPRSFVPLPMCRNGAPCHERAPRGSEDGYAGRLRSRAGEGSLQACRGGLYRCGTGRRGGRMTHSLRLTVPESPDTPQRLVCSCGESWEVTGDPDRDARLHLRNVAAAGDFDAYLAGAAMDSVNGQ
jgi:hypothetical protein